MGSTQTSHLLLLLYPIFLIVVTLLSSQVSGISSDFPALDRPTDDELQPSEERVFQLFQEWKQEQGKVYLNEKEEEMRLDKFRKNVKYIVSKNSKRKSDSDHLVGLTKFADMSNEEFREVHASKLKIPFSKRKAIKMIKNIGERNYASCEAPRSRDWRKHGAVTEVKDQALCGACWAFSASGAMEGLNAIVTGELISLSVQELIFCDNNSTNKGCYGGFMDPAFEWVINNGGIDSEADYPYSLKQRTCNITKENHKAVTIDGYRDVVQEESALLCAVAQQPVSVGIDGTSADFQLYEGGIYDGQCSSNPDDLTHAVLIVGYGSQGDDDYWIIKNSWGTTWGMEGYAYIKRNTNLPYGVCAINSLASYPTKEPPSASSPYPSPAAPPPPSPSLYPSPTVPPPPTPSPVVTPPPSPSPYPSPAAAPPPSPSPYPSPAVLPPPSSSPYPSPSIPPVPSPSPYPSPVVLPPPSPSPYPSPAFKPPPSPSPYSCPVVTPPPLPSPYPSPAVLPPPSPSPYPSPSVSPVPSPSPAITPTPSPSPPSPSPKPSECGNLYYCPEDQTCCCEMEFFGTCFIQSCCPHKNSVCCDGSEYCCPIEYPVCNVYEGVCQKRLGDALGVSPKKRRMAKFKLPWSSSTKETEEEMDQTLKWKRVMFLAMV